MIGVKIVAKLLSYFVPSLYAPKLMNASQHRIWPYYIFRQQCIILFLYLSCIGAMAKAQQINFNEK